MVCLLGRQGMKRDRYRAKPCRRQDRVDEGSFGDVVGVEVVTSTKPAESAASGDMGGSVVAWGPSHRPHDAFGMPSHSGRSCGQSAADRAIRGEVQSA